MGCVWGAVGCGWGCGYGVVADGAAGDGDALPAGNQGGHEPDNADNAHAPHS